MTGQEEETVETSRADSFVSPGGRHSLPPISPLGAHSSHMVLLQQSASLSRCVPCRHRAYSTIAPGQVPFPRASIVPGRSVLKVQGKDAPLFLNGLAAVKIPETFEGRPFYGAFLHAQVRRITSARSNLPPGRS